jgi:hypothetical protein
MRCWSGRLNGAGYVLGVNEAGGVTLATTSGAATAWLASRIAVNDGQWHHVIAEANRKAETFTLYLDGRKDATGTGVGPDHSLANDADLYVAGTPQGHDLNGAIDFLRIARGTLADSKTTIEELPGSSTGHSWTTSPDAVGWRAAEMRGDYQCESKQC